MSYATGMQVPPSAQPQKFRNTPALLEEGFLEECRAMGVIQVTQDAFERTLLAQTVAEGSTCDTSGMLEVLEVLEDYNHAFVFDNRYFMDAEFLARHALV